MRLYVVFSDNTDRLSEYLSAKYEIAGTDRTLDAAVAAALRLDPRPDVFLILGTALASTLVDGKVNWGLALLRNLTELRRACPKSRLVVVLPEAASDSLIREIVRLGIYDVHRVDRVRVEELPEYIENPRTFADVGMNGKQGEVDAAGRPGEIEIEAGDARRGILDRTLERFRRSRPAVDKLGMPSDAALLHDSRLSPYSNLEEALSAARARPPDALLVSENVNLSDVQNLKRNIDFISLAVVMVGPKVDPSVFRYGIDDWIDGVTRANLERVASRSRQMRELWNRANRDALTGCYRRDFFDPWVESQRAGYSLAICDLDDFKAVNDRHGHLLGDAVLSEFGRFLLAAVRQADIVARFGGEEFVLAFPGLPPETAVKIVRGMQDRWNKQTVDGVAVTFSCGVAGSEQGDARDLADKALYAAKAAGKNQVLIYREPVPEVPHPPIVMPVPEAPQPAAPIPEALRLPLATLPSETPAAPASAGRPFAPAYQPINNRVLVVHSPWLEGAGVTTVAVYVARMLKKKKLRVALIDADTRNPGIASALNLPLDQMWRHDWRTLDISAGIRVDGIAVWALDPWRKDNLNVPALRELMAHCEKEADAVVVDAGNDPEQDIPGQSILVASPDPMLPDVARAWNHFKPRTDSILVFNRAGDTHGLYNIEALGLPLGCVLPLGISAEWKNELSGFLFRSGCVCGVNAVRSVGR
ncbi:MAG: diguanylate cyclase [Desulforudis sp.]|nr:MAG: diguanylate cyclase [Desulforudis sp.]